MAGVVEAKSAAEFSKILQNVGSQTVVVHFWADWAPQCQQVNDVVAELAKASKNTAFVKVEAEKVPEISQKFKISAVPTCLILKNEVEVDRVNGVNAAELTKKVEIHSQTSVAMGGNNSTPSTTDPKEALNARLKKLVNAAPVMVFMKGSPEEPRCGFSKTLVQILKDQSVSYASFNILADDSVRQGLKEYSNWPTFPQVYAKGELVGGLDIIKELVESGELQSQMPQAETLDDRLARVVKQQRVMLFMKGNPDTPRCGFSKTTCSILAETGVPYGHFDILSDDEVRQGLKTYSNWPTYPQLYVNGELIGGLDIIKELKETGDLESTLKSVE